MTNLHPSGIISSVLGRAPRPTESLSRYGYFSLPIVLEKIMCLRCLTIGHAGVPFCTPSQVSDYASLSAQGLHGDGLSSWHTNTNTQTRTHTRMAFREQRMCDGNIAQGIGDRSVASMRPTRRRRRRRGARTPVCPSQWGCPVKSQGMPALLCFYTQAERWI